MLVAVDTGGTKTLVAVFNIHGKVVASEKFPTPKEPKEYIEQLVVAINGLTLGHEITAIGLALPGMIKNGHAQWCMNLGWLDVPINTMLKKHFDCPIFIENDANLAGLAETKSLPKRYDNSMYLTVSTGIGMGLIIDHKIHAAIAVTEPGHMMLEHRGKLRPWETFASGKSIFEKYKSYARDIHDKKAWNDIAENISRGMLVLIPSINPDIIILGGSIGTYFERYEAPLRQHLRAHLDEHIQIPELRQAIHPEEAVIYGCYYHALNHLNA